MNIVFVITLFILFFLTLQGWRRGLLGIIYQVVSWLFIFAFILIAQPYIRGYLVENTSLYQRVHEQTLEMVQDKAAEASESVSLMEWYNNITQGLPKDVTAELDKAMHSEQTMVSGQEQQALVQIQEVLVDGMTDFIVKGVAMLITFLLAEIIVAFLGILIRGLGKAPVIRQVNGFLGLIAGAAEGFLVVWILMFAVSCLQGTSAGQALLADIYQNEFLIFLYEHNLIMVFAATI